MEPASEEQPQEEEQEQEEHVQEEQVQEAAQPQVEEEAVEENEEMEEQQQEVQEEEEEKYIPRLLDAAGILGIVSEYFWGGTCNSFSRQCNPPIKRSKPRARVLDCEESCLLP